MKKIFLIAIVLLVGLVSISQPIVNRSNSSITVRDSRLAAQYNFIPPAYNDTSSANLQIGIDSCGAIIFTYSTNGLWVRSCADGKKWVAVGAGGGGGGTVTNVSGTANQIAVATGTTTPVISLVTGGTLPGAWNLGTPSALVGTNISGTAASLSIGGNAATATALQTGRTISISGDLTYTSPSFDGTGNVTAAGTLATVNSNVGTFGSATQVPQLTVNAKGLITAVSNVSITVPTASLLPITGTGTATGAVIGSLAGNTVNIQQGSNPFFTLDPTTDAEFARLRAYNTTGNDNLSFIELVTSATASNTTISSSFDGGSPSSTIQLDAGSGTSNIAFTANTDISYTAATHSITGNVGIGVTPTVLFQVQSGGNDFLSIDPTAGAEASILKAHNTTGDDNVAISRLETSNTEASVVLGASFNNAVKEGAIAITANTTEATIAYSADTHTYTGNVGIGVTPTVLFQVQSGGNDFLSIDPTANSETVLLEAVNVTGGGNSGRFVAGTTDEAAYFNINASFNGGIDEASISGSSETGFSVISYSALTHTFTGTVNLGTAGASNGIFTQSGATSGTITFQTAAAAGTYSLTWPVNDGDASQVLTTDGSGVLSWTTPSGGGANTALSNLAAVAINTSLISDANNTDDLGSSANSWKDIYTRTVQFDGSTSGTITVASDALGNALNTTTLSGTGYGEGTMISRIVGSDFTMTNSATVQPVFGTSQDVWTLQASTTYYFEGMYYFTHGSTSHNVGLSFELGGGASVTSISYTTLVWTTAAGTQTSAQATTLVQVATNVAVVAAGAVAQEVVKFSGFISMSSGGTVTPSITFSADPTGTILAKVGTYITFTPIGTNTISTLGNVN